jgi:hypothetical protein
VRKRASQTGGSGEAGPNRSTRYRRRVRTVSVSCHSGAVFGDLDQAIREKHLDVIQLVG